MKVDIYRRAEPQNKFTYLIVPTGQPIASATALAMHTGVLMLLPSPRPLAPSGVNGDGEYADPALEDDYQDIRGDYRSSRWLLLGAFGRNLTDAAGSRPDRKRGSQ